MLYFQRRDKYR